MRLVIARCSVDYAGRLQAHLPMATRLLIHKNDGSLLVHSDGGSYKPLNWMSPPCTLTVHEPINRGAPERPLPPAEMVAKFRASAGRVFDASRVAAIIATVEDIESLPDIRTLAGLLSTADRG